MLLSVHVWRERKGENTRRLCSGAKVLLASVAGDCAVPVGHCIAHQNETIGVKPVYFLPNWMCDSQLLLHQISPLRWQTWAKVPRSTKVYTRACFTRGTRKAVVAGLCGTWRAASLSLVEIQQVAATQVELHRVAGTGSGRAAQRASSPTSCQQTFPWDQAVMSFIYPTYFTEEFVQLCYTKL